MSLLKAFLKRFGYDDDRPTWKIISSVYLNGNILFNDGRVGRALSPNIKLKEGDRVLVDRKGNIYRFKWEDAKIVLPSLNIPALIVCHVGDTTGDFNKKYYDLNGQFSQESPWRITDDGKYGLIWNGIPSPDPDSYEYTIVDLRGLGVAAVANGIAAKHITGLEARIILNTSMEDEMFRPWNFHVVGPYYDYFYHYLQLEDSLIFAPFWMKSKPWVSRYGRDRYGKDVLVSMHTQWGGIEGVKFLDSFQSDNFQDKLPKVKRIYFTDFEHKGTVKEYLEITGDAALAAACNFYSNGGVSKNVEGKLIFAIQEVIRADTFPWYESNMAEPVRRELYGFDRLGDPFKNWGEDYHRCADEGQYCYFNDAEATSGIETIKNSIGRIYGMTEDNKLDFVFIDKDTEFTQCNTGVYLKDQLIEESGMKPVIELHPDDLNGAPIFIRPVSYQILHTHHGRKFDVMVYRKTRCLTHSSELMPYRVYSEVANGYVQLRKTSIQSETEWRIAVNGQITLLPYVCRQTEYQITTMDTPYEGEEELTEITGAYIQRQPWADVTDPGSVNLTRIFTTEAGQHLLMSFDVFPVRFRHDLLLREHAEFKSNLEAVYDDSEFSFPPDSDSCYPMPQDRIWMLYDRSGKYREIDSPKQLDGKTLVPRVNGVCLLEKE